MAAQTAPSVPARVQGRIIAARVDGAVSAVSKDGGAARALRDGDEVSEHTQIVTSDGAQIILVFTNGASVDLGGNSVLDIDEFRQDPFASDLKISDLKQEPGKSATRLNLTKGELVGKVVHLNVETGSEFVIKTPVGAAGIRGTTFRILFRPTGGGKADFSVSTSEGTVVFTEAGGRSMNVPAGKKVAASVDTGTAGQGGTPAGAPLALVTTNVGAAEAAQIQNAAQAIDSAVNSVVIKPSAGSGGGSASSAAAIPQVSTATTNADANGAATPVQPINPTVVSPSS